MADTRYYKTHVEPYVRKQLEVAYRLPFESRRLTLMTGGTHEFDAVSRDGRIVASIKSLSGKTRTGKRGAARYATCIAELYFLSLISAPTRLLILTTPVQHAMFLRHIEGRLAPGIDIELIGLPPEIQDVVDKIRIVAGDEVSRI